MATWRMAMRVGSGGTSLWPNCRALRIAAITYDPVSKVDLTPFSESQLPPEWTALEAPQKASLRRVAFDMKAGDTIFVKEGPAIVGRGVIIGSHGSRAYQYRPEIGLVDENGTAWPHTVPVEWTADFTPVIATIGNSQIYTVEEVEPDAAARLSSITHAHSPSRMVDTNLPTLNLMIPAYPMGHNPFNLGDHPTIYTPHSLKEKAEALTARSDFFIKYLVGISVAIGGPVPYAFRTRDHKIRSLDAGCLGSLYRRNPPDVSFVLGPDDTIVAVEPSAARRQLYRPIHARLLSDLDALPADAQRTSDTTSRPYLSVGAIRSILRDRGFLETETKKMVRYQHKGERTTSFYVKRPEDGNYHVVRPLVMHPQLPETNPDLLALKGVLFGPKYYHHSNMRDFPERVHTGDSPRKYGISVDFQDELACEAFIQAALAPPWSARVNSSHSVMEAEVLDDLEAAASDLDLANSVTEKISLVKSRIGQGKFRDDLINYWEGCAITSVTTPSFLKASHIKPWRHGTNKERLDKYNGLLLTPNLDHAFDAGLISFDDHGAILISASISAEEAAALGISASMRLRRIEPGHHTYLRWHRDHEFGR